MEKAAMDGKSYAVNEIRMSQDGSLSESGQESAGDLIRSEIEEISEICRFVNEITEANLTSYTTT
jgi:hypothetical protein